MFRYIITSAISGIVIAGAASAATFNFSQQGYDGGGVFAGFFEGEDTNGDGQIVSFDGELDDIRATFQGVGRDGSNIFTTFDFDSLNPASGSLTGFVLTLDGGGTIGDDDSGAIEGFALDNDDYYIAVGPGPAFLCDGFNDCGFISESGEGFFDENEDGPVVFNLSTSAEVINVTTGPVGDAQTLGSAARPFLPEENDDREGPGFFFAIDVGDVTPFQTFFIDPVIAVGYTYEITGSTFTSVTAPTLAQVNDADGAYTLTVNGVSSTILAGQTVNFGAAANVSQFTIEGIDLGLELDPNDPTAFITGVAVSTFTGTLGITQTPITFDTDANGPSPIPLPASFLLLGSVLGVLGASRRRRKA